MLRLYYAEPVAALDDVSQELFSDYRKERLANLRPSERRRQSVAAELLLMHAIRSLDPGCPLPLKLWADENRKPRFVDGGTQFSLSHTKGLVACAVSDRAVGVDVEHERPCHEALARRFFTREEQRFLQASSAPDRDFTMLWTLKESYVKALGLGLRQPLNSFSVCIGERIVVREDDSVGFWHTCLGSQHIAICVPGCPKLVPDTIENIKLL